MSRFMSSANSDAFQNLLEERNGTIALLESELEATVNALASERVESFNTAYDENKSSNGNKPASKISSSDSKSTAVWKDNEVDAAGAAVAADVKRLEEHVKKLEEEKENLLLLYRTSEGKLQIRTKQVQECERERESIEKACANRIEEYKEKILAVDKQRKSVYSELELAITQLGEYRASCVEKDMQLKDRDRQLRALGKADELRKEADKGLSEAHAAIATAKQKMEESEFTSRSRLKDYEDKVHFLEQRCKENDVKIDNLTKRNFYLETEYHNLKMENTQFSVELEKALSINKTSMEFIGNNINSPSKTSKAPQTSSSSGRGPLLTEASRKIEAQARQMRAFAEGSAQQKQPESAKSTTSPVKAAAHFRSKEELQSDASLDFDDSMATSAGSLKAKKQVPRSARSASSIAARAEPSKVSSSKASSATAKPTMKAKPTAKKTTYPPQRDVGDPFITIKDGDSLKRAVHK